MMTILIILAVVLILLVLWYVSTYNSLVRWRNQVEEAFSSMDVMLKQRYDLIPNLVETVKGYAKHESETLENVINARNKAVSATTVQDKMASEGELNSVMNRLFSLTEAYPDLKANSDFVALQQQLTTMEDKIASSRNYYNGSVKRFNTMVESIPSSIVASIGHFERAPLFEITDTVQRENVKVSF